MYQEISPTNFPSIIYDYEKNYIKFIKKQQKLIIKGSRGHNTFYLKNSVASNNYYFQIIGYQPQFYSQFLKYPSTFRVGVSPSYKSFILPLGQQNTVGYKSNGQLVTDKTVKQFGQAFQQEDIIGVGISGKDYITQSRKDYISQEIRKRKKFLNFYKNGKSIGKSYQLKPFQQWYFTVSLYNQAQVQLKTQQQDIKFLPQGFLPYSSYKKY